MAIGTAVRQTKPLGDDRHQPFVTSISFGEMTLLRRSGHSPLGLVMGSCVYHGGRRPLSIWAKSLRQNSEMSSITAALYEARERAMTRLQIEAARLGADGVVGVTTAEHSHFWGSRMIEFFAIGTAVRNELDGPESSDPTMAVLLNDDDGSAP